MVLGARLLTPGIDHTGRDREAIVPAPTPTTPVACKPVVVIPSIRDVVPERIAAIPEDVDIVVVDDSNGNIRPSRDRMKVFDYRDQRELMGGNSDLIPRKTAACRNFAFYYVWKCTDHDLIISIDDDVVCPPGFVDTYRMIGTEAEWPNVRVDGWYNPLGAAGVTDHDGRTLYPRGFPFWLRHPQAERRGTIHGRLMCLMGLWSNILDHDGIDRYVFTDCAAPRHDVSLREPVVTVGSQQCPTKFPFSAMNFALHRDLLPAAYQMPMDREIAAGYPLRRFDDIWAGYVIQSLVHRRANGDLVGIGVPIVRHEKHGDLRREIHGEHYGHLMAPYFYDLIDLGIAATAPDEYAGMYMRLSTHLVDNFDSLCDEVRCPELYRRYFGEMFDRVRRWATLFA